MFIDYKQTGLFILVIIVSSRCYSMTTVMRLLSFSKQVVPHVQRSQLLSGLANYHTLGIQRRKDTPFTLYKNDNLQLRHFHATGHSPLVGCNDYKYTLLKNGIDHISSGLKLSDGRSSLHCAVERCSLAAVKLCLESGLDIGAEDKRGFQPIHFASQGKSLEVLRYLLDQVADYEAQTKEEKTPVLLAAMCGNVQFMKELLERGANKNVVSSDKRSLFHEAASSNSVACVEACFSLGLDPEVEDSQGWRPLHCAVYYGAHDTVEYLLKKNVCRDPKTKDGLAPMELGNIPYKEG